MAAAKRVLRYLCRTSGMGLVLGGRRPVVLTGHADASWADDQATQRSSQGYTFSLGSGSVSWRSSRLSSALSSSCEAEIYAGAMAAQELRWLTYLLTDLGEPPRSPPVLYVDNKAMLALCLEHRLEHRTKHIALRYFLARGQVRLAYMASQANTVDIFTKALPPGDHQRFCTMLGFAYLRRDTKNLLKQGNKVRSRPHSASSTSSSRASSSSASSLSSSCTCASSSSATSASASSSSASSPSSSRLHRVSSSSAPNTISPGSSSTLGTSTSRSSSRSTSSTTNYSRNSSTSSSSISSAGSSTPKACAQKNATHAAAPGRESPSTETGSAKHQQDL
ncbi:unnamed protein product [Closterium sp. NIES-54]